MENEFFIPFIWFSMEISVFIRREKEKYNCLWALAALSALGFCLATDTGIITTSAGLCLMAVFTIIMLPNLLANENLKHTVLTEKSLSVLCIGVLTCVFSMRIVFTWTDSLLTGNYSYYIEKGPLKGTYTDETAYQIFNNIMSDLDKVSYKEDDILFCGRNTPLAYLYSNMECGTMSTYLLETDYERLEQYYALHPDKFPTIVYYYPLGSYPVTEQDIESDFMQYIKYNYEVFEIDGRILAKINALNK
ncbi:MAG: hypothetical protein NC313_06910 [Butyrivibrio sp.]|nr:hypothetical protein [Butyrivibrio sp.]